jgi:hypothetical protein
VLAKLFIAFRDAPESLTTSKLRALVLSPIMLWLLVDHAVIEPIFLPSRARGNVAMRDILDRAQAGVPSDPEIADKRVIYINPAAVPLAAYLPVERAVQEIPRPAFQTWLATADTEVRVRRIDARTLHVHPRGGYMLSPPSRLFAGRVRAFHVGETIEVGPVRFEITGLMPDGRAAHVSAHFDRPLEDPSFVWRKWDDLTFRPFSPPAIGESTVLPAADYLRVVFGEALPLPFDGRMPTPPDPYWDKQ